MSGTIEKRDPTSASAHEHHHYDGQDLEALADLPHYQEWILEPFRPHLTGRVLEIGAGIGNLAQHYVSQAREVVLIEPAKNLCLALEQRFRSTPNVHVRCATSHDLVTEARADLSVDGAHFDTAILVNVLEHIEDDLGELRAIRSLLRPGGALLVFVPAMQWLYGSLDEVVEHRRRYSLESLANVVESAGFEPQQARYFDVLGILPWFITGRVLRMRTFNARGARLYDQLAVPVGRAVERYFLPRWGKNAFCVARSRSDNGGA